MEMVPLVEWLQEPGREGVGVQEVQGAYRVVLAMAAYRATEAMGGLVLVLLEPCFSCLSLDPHGSPLNRWMVTRS